MPNKKKAYLIINVKFTMRPLSLQKYVTRCSINSKLSSDASFQNKENTWKNMCFFMCFFVLTEIETFSGRKCLRVPLNL